jgi:hypothetical protein
MSKLTAAAAADMLLQFHMLPAAMLAGDIATPSWVISPGIPAWV